MVVNKRSINLNISREEVDEYVENEEAVNHIVKDLLGLRLIIDEAGVVRHEGGCVEQQQYHQRVPDVFGFALRKDDPPLDFPLLLNVLNLAFACDPKPKNLGFDAVDPGKYSISCLSLDISRLPHFDGMNPLLLKVHSLELFLMINAVIRVNFVNFFPSVVELQYFKPFLILIKFFLSQKLKSHSFNDSFVIAA